MTTTYQLRCEVKLDWWQVLYLPGKAALFLLVGPLVFSRPFILSDVAFMVGFFWAFILVFFVPMSCLVAYMNKPIVIVILPNVKIVPDSGFISGWTLPLGGMRWRITEDRQLILYPFSFLRFAKSAGMRPYRLLLKIPPEGLDQWIAALDPASKI